MYHNPKLSLRNNLSKAIERSKKKRLTLIDAAPGSGKSTLVESFLETKSVPICWYTCTKDNNLSNFNNFLWEFLISHSFINNQAENNNSLYPSPLDINPFPIQDTFYIILENSSAIAPDSEITCFISQLNKLLPANIHIIFLSPLPLEVNSRENVNKWDLNIIRKEEFVFTPKETTVFYKKVFNLEFTHEQIMKLYELTEGWLAAMVAIGHYLQSVDKWKEFFEFKPDSVFKKLSRVNLYMEKIFELYTSYEQEVLLKTSLLENFNPDELSLLVDEDASLYLPQMTKKGLLFTYNKEFNNYRCHALFKEYLYLRAIAVFGDIKIEKLHNLLGDYFNEKKNWNNAFSHYINGKNLNAAKNILKKTGPQVIKREQSMIIKKLLSQIPINDLQNDPWLNYFYACLFRFREPALCYKFIADALEIFKKNHDIDGEIKTLCLKIEVLMFYPGQLADMNNLVQKPPPSTSPLSKNELRLTAYKMVYESLAHCYLTGNLDKALQLSEEAKKLSSIIKDENLNLWSSLTLTIVSSYIGNFEVAKGNIAEAFQIRSIPGNDEIIATTIPFIAGLINFYSGNFQKSQNYLDQALEESNNLKLDILDFYIIRFVVLNYTYLQDKIKSDKNLAQMQERVNKYLKPSNYHLNSFFLLTRAEHAFLWNNNYRAAELAEQALEQRKKAGGKYYLSQCYLLLGTTLSEINEFGKGIYYLGKALELAQVTNSTYMEISAYIQLAICYLRQNDYERFTRIIKKAITLGEQHSYTFFYGWRDDHMSILINEAKKILPQLGYLKELENRINNKFTSVNSPTFVSSFSKMINISMLGTLNIEINNSPITNINNRKPITLLKTLAIHDRPLSMDKILEELWPSHDSIKARNNFYFTLHQLRKILNSREAIIFEEGYCSINPDLCFIDVHLFEKLFIQGKELQKSKQEMAALRVLSKAKKLYRGALLENEILDNSLLMKRNTLANIYYNLLLLKGEVLLKNTDFENAINILNEATNHEFANEYAFRLLMLAFFCNADKVQALKTYSRLKNHLQEYFDVHPSKKTDELYLLIKNNHELPHQNLKVIITHYN